MFVPVQGFLNALVYGWTREDFLTTMSTRYSVAPPHAVWRTSSHEESVEDDKEETENSHVSFTSQHNEELEETYADDV